MKDPLHHDPVDIVGEAYEAMLERVLDGFQKLGDKTGPAVHKLFDNARDKAVELGELSREEAEKLSDYVKRDLTDAAEYLSESGDELQKWLGFETRLIEAEMLQLFMRAADKTTLELYKLKEKAEQASSYHTGEVTGLGTLVCDQCGEHLHFRKPGRIPPCPKCHATAFHRGRGAESTD
jgi:hypothetical protein